MMMGTSRSLILVMGVLAIAGCDDRLPSDSNPVSSVAEPCAPAFQAPMVFYDKSGTPSKYTAALSETELRSIMDAVGAQTEDAVWFVRAKPSLEAERRGPVIVYLAPQKQTPRIRAGSAYAAWVTGEKTRVDSHLFEYMQVSVADQPFTEQLTLPLARDLPFVRPTAVDPNSKTISAMSEEEVIRIVDFVRDPSNYDDSLVHRTSPKEEVIRAVQEMPILGMRKEGDKIHVQCGFQHDGTWGYGRSITLECTSTGYRITMWSKWVS